MSIPPVDRRLVVCTGGLALSLSALRCPIDSCMYHPPAKRLTAALLSVTVPSQQANWWTARLATPLAWTRCCAEEPSVAPQGMLGVTPPVQQPGVAKSKAVASSPTCTTEMLTLRWPALMPALLWRLRQPLPLLPALRSLNLSHNGLQGWQLF